MRKPLYFAAAAVLLASPSFSQDKSTAWPDRHLSQTELSWLSSISPEDAARAADDQDSYWNPWKRAAAKFYIQDGRRQIFNSLPADKRIEYFALAGDGKSADAFLAKMPAPKTTTTKATPIAAPMEGALQGTPAQRELAARVTSLQNAPEGSAQPGTWKEFHPVNGGAPIWCREGECDPPNRKIYVFKNCTSQVQTSDHYWKGTTIDQVNRSCDAYEVKGNPSGDYKEVPHDYTMNVAVKESGTIALAPEKKSAGDGAAKSTTLTKTELAALTKAELTAYKALKANSKERADLVEKYKKVIAERLQMMKQPPKTKDDFAKLSNAQKDKYCDMIADESSAGASGSAATTGDAKSGQKGNKSLDQLKTSAGGAATADRVTSGAARHGALTADLAPLAKKLKSDGLTADCNAYIASKSPTGPSLASGSNSGVDKPVSGNDKPAEKKDKFDWQQVKVGTVGAIVGGALVLGMGFPALAVAGGIVGGALLFWALNKFS